MRDRVKGRQNSEKKRLGKRRRARYGEEEKEGGREIEEGNERKRERLWQRYTSRDEALSRQRESAKEREQEMKFQIRKRNTKKKKE